MKKRIILFLKKFLLILTIGVTIIKIGFEIDNYYYETKLTNMEKENELTLNPKSLIKHKKLELAGCSIHYYTSGMQNTESIILLHPAFSDHSAFDQQIDTFYEPLDVLKYKTVDISFHYINDLKKIQNEQKRLVTEFMLGNNFIELL